MEEPDNLKSDNLIIGDLKISDLALAVNPERYFQINPDDVSGSLRDRKRLKELVNQHGIIEGLKMAREEKISLKPKPVSSYKLIYDSQQAQLEPIYYWLLDFIEGKGGGWKMEKWVDNFTASPGSGQFSEMSGKATRMQEEGMKILGGLNQVVKSVLNLVYDLKEFELRLAHYDDAKSKDKKEKETGLLALKQIWLDNVDLKRGRGSIHQMAAELGYTTIREVFMMANSQEDLKRMNKEDKEEGGGGIINDQVLRILEPRLSEFLKWVNYSDRELRKRFSIEKNYLRSQVETIKLYSAWMRPYLKAAEDLRQKGFDKNASLVHAFSTSMFNLVLFGKRPTDVPKTFHGYKLKRGYNQCIVIEFKYRGHVSQRVTQKGDYGFSMGGRVDMTFEAYVLNDEEFSLVKKAFEKDNLDESMAFSLDIAGGALKELKEDLDYFLKSDADKAKEAKTEEKKEEVEDINPFSALLGLFKKSDKGKKGGKGKVEEVKDIKPDNYIERVVRAEATALVGKELHDIYDIYKKAHDMASAPLDGFEKTEEDTEIIEKAKAGGDVNFWGAFKGRDSN